MKTLLAIAVAGACALGFQHPGGKRTMYTEAARTYEHLAVAIIEIRAVEDNLVRGILLHHQVMADRNLDKALEATGSDRGAYLERAAEEITNIANEGDKEVQAIRQRLLMSGHHHHTDAETHDDYMFVDSAEKQELLALATKLSKMGRGASETQIDDAREKFNTLFDDVIAAE